MRKPLQGLALETSSEGGTMLGALELKGKALILRVNSKERARSWVRVRARAAAIMLPWKITDRCLSSEAAEEDRG
ncbi:hypothetical protein LV780_18500 [Cereibacter azotoformans]|nr:hypothetical protein [Cereibacter azotoformans]AXQ95453.1 hypothetical protein D0Z66_16775 [Cereibacter sphaeroides]UIJ32308.1 hypothetical protein LV780_18500 [Cereibacter azotoformans]